MAPRPPLERDAAWSYLLDLLARRDYTEAELRSRLARRGVADDVAEALLGRLRELGLADDDRFAERYVATRRRARGRLALRGELRRKGVDPALIEREVGGLSSQQQVESAVALLRRFAWRYRPGSASRRAGTRPGAAPSGGGESASGRPAVADEAEARRAALKERARAFAFLARRGFTADVANDAIAALGWWEEGA